MNSNNHDLHRTRIKLCGLSKTEDVDTAVAIGADAVGFVFYPPSPRSVSVAQAVELAEHVPPLVSAVGLFANATPEWVREVTSNVRLSLLQFHGDETPEQCAALAEIAGLPWWRAVRVGPDATARDLVESSLNLFSSQRFASRHSRRRLRWRWKGIRLVTYPNRSRASGRFEWWVERAKRP